MEKELKLEDLETLYNDFLVFLNDKKFIIEYENLLATRPMLSIEKEAEYTSLIRDTLYEFLNNKGYTKLTPMLISFIVQFDRLHYGKMQETYIHCYR